LTFWRVSFPAQFFRRIWFAADSTLIDGFRVGYYLISHTPTAHACLQLASHATRRQAGRQLESGESWPRLSLPARGRDRNVSIPRGSPTTAKCPLKSLDFGYDYDRDTLAAGWDHTGIRVAQNSTIFQYRLHKTSNPHGSGRREITGWLRIQHAAEKKQS
jgi:hypothetical protein